MSVPMVIAHRGNSSEAVENSLEAFRKALALPADMIELDLRKSRDDVLYVMHDAATGRTADRSISIEQETSAVIDAVRLDNGEPVPTLSAVFKTVAGTAGLNLELKTEGAAEVLARQIAGSDYPGYVLVSSFHVEDMLTLRKLLPTIRTSGIFDVFTEKDLPAYAALGFEIISLRKRAVTPELLASCRKRGIAVYVWTVDDEAEMKVFIGMGVDGIYTNKPRLLKDVILHLEQR